VRIDVRISVVVAVGDRRYLPPKPTRSPIINTTATRTPIFIKKPFLIRINEL